MIATAERASAELRINRDPRRGGRTKDKHDWAPMTAAVDAAVRSTHPELVDDAVATVSFLMCSEAAERARRMPLADDEEFSGDRSRSTESARQTKLTFTDDEDVVETWSPDGPRTAAAEFWEFVDRRSAGDNEVFTIEDEELGEGLQLHFYADSIARITTVAQGEGGADPE